MKIHHQILQSLAFFTRLPLTRWCPPADSMKALVWTFPIAGAIIGLACGEVYRLLYDVGFAYGLAVLLMIGFQLCLTGALHEDGLADTVDGFAGGRDKESRLAIMRDSRIGAFGALALIIIIALRAYALMLLVQPKTIVLACIVAGAMSRAMIAVSMFALPHARADGLAAWAGKPSVKQVLVSAYLASLIAMTWLPVPGLMVIATSLVVCGAVCMISKSKIGGVTGDVYGAIQQSVEAAILVAATLLLVAH